MVAPDCPLTAAVALSQRFRTSLVDQTISTQGMDIGVTASVGIATTDWTQHSPAELFHQADGALYQAKRSGRNAVWVYDTSGRVPIEVGRLID